MTVQVTITPNGRMSLPAEIRLQVVPDSGLICAAIDCAPGADAARVLDAALLNSVIETAPDAIITIDSRGRIGGFSPAAERLFGYTAAEVIGKNVSILMPEPHRSRHDAYMRRYLETGVVPTGARLKP